MSEKTVKQAEVVYNLAKQLPTEKLLIGTGIFIAWGAKLPEESQKNQDGKPNKTA